MRYFALAVPGLAYLAYRMVSAMVANYMREREALASEGARLRANMEHLVQERDMILWEIELSKAAK